MILDREDMLALADRVERAEGALFGVLYELGRADDLLREGRARQGLLSLDAARAEGRLASADLDRALAWLDSLMPGAACRICNLRVCVCAEEGAA